MGWGQENSRLKHSTWMTLAEDETGEKRDFFLPALRKCIWALVLKTRLRPVSLPLLLLRGSATENLVEGTFILDEPSLLRPP